MQKERKKQLNKLFLSLEKALITRSYEWPEYIGFEKCLMFMLNLYTICLAYIRVSTVRRHVM